MGTGRANRFYTLLTVFILCYSPLLQALELDKLGCGDDHAMKVVLYHSPGRDNYVHCS
jgi:hypothetical protein